MSAQKENTNATEQQAQGEKKQEQQKSDWRDYLSTAFTLGFLVLVGYLGYQIYLHPVEITFEGLKNALLGPAVIVFSFCFVCQAWEVAKQQMRMSIEEAKEDAKAAAEGKHTVQGTDIELGNKKTTKEEKEVNEPLLNKH
eukprot:GDKI01015385.1.p2 GENE.GDKI01015385.1~~GDKI01015385.1.p2  ORF type:complete len:140 (-),score=60.81 GDKI01015385.1:105-524(-)